MRMESRRPGFSTRNSSGSREGEVLENLPSPLHVAEVAPELIRGGLWGGEKIGEWIELSGDALHPARVAVVDGEPIADALIEDLHAAFAFLTSSIASRRSRIAMRMLLFRKRVVGAVDRQILVERVGVGALPMFRHQLPQPSIC